MNVTQIQIEDAADKAWEDVKAMHMASGYGRHMELASDTSLREFYEWCGRKRIRPEVAVELWPIWDKRYGS